MPPSDNSLVASRRGPESPSARDHALRNWAAVAAFGVIGLVAFSVLGQDIVQRPTSNIDRAVRAWVHANQWTALVASSRVLSTVASVNPLVCVAIGCAMYLVYRRRFLVAMPLLVAPALGVQAYATLKNLFARARPSALATALEGGTYSFPSAHATSSTAICCTIAYVFWRERLIDDTVALSVGVLVPFLVGLSRIYLDVHWTTDILGGWSAGVLVAALCAALYNSIRHVEARRRSTVDVK